MRSLVAVGVLMVLVVAAVIHETSGKQYGATLFSLASQYVHSVNLAGHRHALFLEYQQGKETGYICLLAEHESKFIHSVYSDSDDCMISSNITLFWHSIGYTCIVFRNNACAVMYMPRELEQWAL